MGRSPHEFRRSCPAYNPGGQPTAPGGHQLSRTDKPGHYYIVVAFDAEGNVEDFMSGTNWKMPVPIWNDGNDIVDWSSAQLAHANAFGWADTRILKINDLNNKVEMLPHSVPATVIGCREAIPVV